MPKFLEKYHIYAIVMFVASFAFVYLMLNAQYWRALIADSNSDIAIGELTIVKNEVRIKNQSASSWQLAFDSDSVKKGDVVATGADSETTVNIDKVGSIRLSPNSLIVIGMSNNQPVFDVRVGSIEATVQKGRSILIKDKEKLIEASFDKISKIEVVSDTKSTSIKNISEENPLIISSTQNEVIEVPSIAIPADPIFIAPPQYEKTKGPPIVLKKIPQDIILNYENNHNERRLASVDSKLVNPPRLTWSGGSPPYTIEISTTKDFSAPIISETVIENNYTWQSAKIGSYYWRVRSADVVTVSKPLPLKAIHAAIKLDVPFQMIEVTSIEDYEKKPVELSIAWENLPDVEKYRLEVRKTGNSNFKSIAIVNRSLATFSTESPGKYEARVVALNNKEAILSAPGAYYPFEINKKLKLVAPTINFPPNNAVVQSFWEKKSEPLIFSWTPGEAGIEYEIEASSYPDFKQSIKLAKTTEANKLVDSFPKKIPRAYWRVRSTYKDFVSPWSEVRTIQFASSSNF